MNTYIYKAKKNTAETISGQIKAGSQEEAIDLINQLGLLPISVKPSQSSQQTQTKRKFSGKVTSKELYLFSQQLSNLLKSGVSILYSLTIIAEQTQSAYFKKVIIYIASQIKNGKSLSYGLSNFTNIFSPLFITMIRAGEESGNLQEMFVHVSSYQKRQEEINSKVRSAVAYPVFMAFFGVVTVYFILTFVLPKLGALFSGMSERLPMPTVILLKVADLLSQGGIWILSGVCLSGFLFLQWSKSKMGRWALSRIFLNMPILGTIILKIELSRFCRTLVLLLRGGVSIVNSLQVAIPLMSNDVIKRQLTLCRKNLLAGGSFGETLKRSKQIPPMMGHLITVGEESGNIDGVLDQIADTYERETDDSIRIMTTLLEPVMILAVGLVVGLIVFAILLPIFQIDVLAPR